MTDYYLAGRWERRDELRGYADELRALGHNVTSRWLWSADDDYDERRWAEYANKDFADIVAASIFVAFTEQPGTMSRGGRHVEWGYARAHGTIQLNVVGPIESQFYAIADGHYRDWASARELRT